MFLLEGDRLLRFELFGEDTCELLNTIELSFGVTLTDDDRVQAVNIQALAECIHKKLTNPLSEKCLSAVVFYRLRRTFMSLLNIPRANIAPEVSLTELLTWKARNRIWRGTQERLGYVLPALTWPLWLVGLSLAIVAMFFTIPAFGWHRLMAFAGSASGIFTFLGALCLWVLVCKLLSPLGRALPKGCKTFADLVKLTLARNYAKIASEHGMSSEREVLNLLCQLITVELGLENQKVSPRTLFPEGLNIY
jgi:hypothetical protein